MNCVRAAARAQGMSKFPPDSCRSHRNKLLENLNCQSRVYVETDLHDYPSRCRWNITGLEGSLIERTKKLNQSCDFARVTELSIKFPIQKSAPSPSPSPFHYSQSSDWHLYCHMHVPLWTLVAAVRVTRGRRNACLDSDRNLPPAEIGPLLSAGLRRSGRHSATVPTSQPSSAQI